MERAEIGISALGIISTNFQVEIIYSNFNGLPDLSVAIHKSIYI